jgi:dipeptide/tripeptide permease
VKKLQLQNLSHIVCSSFLFWTLYKQVGLVIQFHIKKFVHMGWTNQRGQPKKEKEIMHIVKVPTFATYLFT